MTPATATPSTAGRIPAAAPSTPKKPEWAPRIWEGCDFFAWLKLLFRNRCAVEFRYWYIAIIVTFVSFSHTVLRLVQTVIFGRALSKVELKGPPIFILGHWRSGTTLLHELMICDERFGYPTTYECVSDPHHFLLTEGLFTRVFKFLLPSRRPMDNMKVGFDRPQEDEFALCMMGQGSPYLTIAFPNHPPQCEEYLDLEGIPPKKLVAWKRCLEKFLKRVTYKSGKRLVLKSPPHTARMKVLQEMFPQAIFIHIVRDPYTIYASTVNLWRTLYKMHGFQAPKYVGLEEHVLNTYVRMYQRLEEGKKLVEPGRFYELRYEDLIQDPAGEMKKIYEHVNLGGFDDFLPRLQAYLAANKGYETNKYQLTAEQRAQVTERWGEVIRRYGYDKVAVSERGA